MKNIFGLALIAMLAMAMAGCGGDDEVVTQLTIRNESSESFTNTLWNGVQFQVRTNSGANTITTYNSRINPGNSITSNVNPGTGFIYFNKMISSGSMYSIGGRFRTMEAVTIDAGEIKDFVFTDNTLVVAID